MVKIFAAIKAHRYLAIMVTGLALFAVLAGAQNQNVEWSKRNSIEAKAHRTKTEGKTKVVIPPPRIEYGGSDMSMAEALQDYSVFVAEPLESKVYAVDSFHIVTWYRVAIKETLSLRAPAVCDSCPQPAPAPVDMPPAKSGEFLISKVGGTTTVDGVEVTMDELDVPKFEIGKRYLMFVSLTPTGIAMFAGGPTNVFRINDLDKLEVLANKSTHLHSELRDRFDLSLSGFRAYVKP